ncbi:MAG TPA: MFS transporter [Noviherbaspirillum sp.]|uniref:MFS transporter n=1 Tax=Noviherbaspirillum sp. TaxID=1926288 RepID=UPI002B49E07B|nr:MFS transporter [Noviherbaspirillum sp.]HJV84639.1 MFS transporter [Noviherbaspirillum sp.]
MIARHWAFFVSCLLAFTGGHIINYSVIMYAQEVLRSDVLAGVGFGLCFGPPLLLGWYAGVLCDRLAPTRIIHAAQAVFVLAAVLMAYGDHFIADPALRAPVFLSAALCAGIGWSFVAPARMTALGQIVDATALRRASLIFNLLVMLGFGLGPLAISVCRLYIGWQAAFALAVALFVVGSALLFHVSTSVTGKPPRPVLRDILDGLGAVRRDPLLAQLLVTAMFGYMLMGPMQVILPKLTRTTLGMGELGRGAFLGTLAPALIAGGLLCMLIARCLPHGKTVFAACALSGLLFAGMGRTTNPSVAFVLLALVGLLGGVAISLIVTAIQENVDEKVRGRVLSMYTVISQVMPALSGLAAGALTQALDAQRAILVVGGVLALAALVNATWMPALRSYRGH